MVPANDVVPSAHIEAGLDGLAATEAASANCMFQLALMVARIAVEPCAETYKEEAAQALLGLIRAKPRSGVGRLFGAAPSSGPDRSLRGAVA